MSRPTRLLAWLEDKSDWLSPLLVKEVRQLVRGREFMLSFGASLVVALVFAFFGAAEALTGSNTSGSWTFVALMSCLGFLGLAVVPLGAFTALRNERMAQTLELITLTSLSSRRIVIGKLLAQAVKLVTLFAAIAPFMTMSFLLGGIDFTTILVALVSLFMASVWIGALCLFLSTTKSRIVAVLVFGAIGIVSLFFLAAGRGLFFALSSGMLGASFFGISSGGPSWVLVFSIAASFWLVSLVNLVLLAENRLALATEDSVTPLRIGFFVQFLLIVGWTLWFINDPSRSDAADALAIFGSAHIALVAVFVVTEEMTVPRRVLQRMRSGSPRGWLLALFGTGGGRGATYVLLQMVILYAAVSLLQPAPVMLRQMIVVCGYICLFTGVPTLAFWLLAGARATATRLRVAVLITLAVSMVVPDIVYYVIWRPDILDLSFNTRHLINPIRTLASWDVVEAQGWYPVPIAFGLIGLVALLGLIRLGVRETARRVPVDPHRPAPVAGEAGRGDVLY